MKKTLERQFGERVKALRQSKGITQIDLAERIGITCQGISSIERGAVGPRFPTILKIATVLNVKPKDLFDF